jgi:predicted ATPase
MPLPSGTVTFLFTDVEASTRLLLDLGDRYAGLLAEHRSLLRDVFERHGGVEVDTQGDACFVAFGSARRAVAAAREVQDALTGPLRVRVGLHTGEAQLVGGNYVGIDVHRAARIAAAGHGGQILLSQSTRDLVDAVVWDLGLHWLKDLSAPERLYQLGHGEFPPLRTLAHTNLPTGPTPFIGREEERGHVLGLLRQPQTRLLTITGAGGSGKTRLALEAASELAFDFHDGVWFVDLAPLRDPALVMATIARVVGTHDDVAADLRGKRLLVVLDNFEHLLAAAVEISGLLAACPKVKALVTSREPLHLVGEQEYALAPLSLPDAIALFTQRARLVRHDLSTSDVDGEICRRLDCLPLAIELAAARVKVLEPDALLARLERRLPLLVGGPRDAPERQRTLRATLEWSHELLSSAEQRLLSRLSVFAGGWTLDAAVVVCAADVDTLQSLVDKCLADRDGERFRMLDTIREFALELLEKSREAHDLRRRHAEHQLRLAHELGLRRRGPKPEASLMEFELEEGNMRAALEWLLEADPERALRLALHLDGYWWMRDRLRECDHWLTKALRRADAADPILRADALREAADTAFAIGDEQRANRLYEESLAIAEQAGATKEIAAVLINLGRAKEGLALYREVGWEPGIAITLHRLADGARDLGDFERARSLYAESIALWRRLGIVWGLKNALIGRGDCGLDQCLLNEAAEAYEEALGIATRVGSELSVAHCLGGLSAVAAARGRVEVAARLWGAVESIESAHDVELLESERIRYKRRVQSAVDAAQPALEDGRSLPLTAAVKYALASMD